MGSGDIYLGVNNTGHILFDTGATISTTYMTISGGLRVSDDVIAFAISDERVKDNVQPISNALEKLEKITSELSQWKQSQEEVLKKRFQNLYSDLKGF